MDQQGKVMLDTEAKLKELCNCIGVVFGISEMEQDKTGKMEHAICLAKNGKTPGADETHSKSLKLLLEKYCV